MNRTPHAGIRRGAAALLAASCVLALAASCRRGTGDSPDGTDDAAAPTASAQAPTASASAAPSAPSEADAAPAPSADEDADAAAPPPGKCPEATSPERLVSTFDWSKNLGVDAPMAAKLRGVSGTAVEIRLFAGQVGNELRNACAGIAADLGNRGSFPSAPVACQAAVDAMKTARAKLGPGAKVAVHVHPAFCAESLDEVKSCEKRCTGDEQPPETSCFGQTVGKCQGTCEGACELRKDGACEGQCQGQCEGGFAGTCEGSCKGKCNGKAMKQPAECKGKCEGSCDVVTSGECKGRCAGGCQIHNAACPGMCAGRCSVPLQDVRCAGTVKVGGSPECAPYCDLFAARHMACSPGQVDVRVSGAKDAAAASAYRTAIERHMPMLLRVERQLAGRADGLGRAKAVVSAGTKAITAGAGAAAPALSECVNGYDKAATDGVASLAEDFRAVSEVTLAAKAR